MDRLKRTMEKILKVCFDEKEKGKEKMKNKGEVLMKSPPQMITGADVVILKVTLLMNYYYYFRFKAFIIS